MNPRGLQPAVLAVGVLLGGMSAAFARAGLLLDPAGDPKLRRTDPNNNGLVNPSSVLPDLISAHAAASSEHPADIFQLEVAFQGLINPPGPLGLSSLPFQPFRYGPSPIYGSIDIDIDSDVDTGGELGEAARVSYLANAARFGEMLAPPLAARQVVHGWTVDEAFESGPQFERSGVDFSLVFCGCYDITVLQDFGDADSIFGSGDTWIVQGRFFQRAGGYAPISGAFGGSFFGLYDPLTSVTFSHDPVANVTTLRLSFALTPAGAAILTAQPEEPVDLDVSNQVSIVEAMQDVIEGVSYIPVPEPAETLAGKWRDRLATDHLDPSNWTISALVGTTYAFKDPSGALYVWTDAAGQHFFGDLDHDGSLTELDLMAFDAAVGAFDGGSKDADGIVNGVVRIPAFAVSFSGHDFNSDGQIGPLDREVLVPPPPPVIPGDADRDCTVTFADVVTVLRYWGATYPQPGLSALGDADGDARVLFSDVSSVLRFWGSACSE
ncbi:MAG: hypothetical protein SFZ24_06705 [Planctomycetota bacterium]|nr:hypothetical protein [Planctomycetota bacterium]